MIFLPEIQQEINITFNEFCFTKKQKKFFEKAKKIEVKYFDVDSKEVEITTTDKVKGVYTYPFNAVEDTKLIISVKLT